MSSPARLLGYKPKGLYMVIVDRLDYIAFYAKDLLKTLYIKQNINDVITPYDLTGKTVELRVYDRSNPAVLLYTLDPDSVGEGFAIFNFSIANTTQDSPVDTILIEDLGVEGEQILQYGSINFVDLTKQVIPFKDMVSSETPGNMVIPDAYINYKSYEWRLFLKNSLTPPIADVDLNNENAWPIEVNFLIAKLIVFNYIEKQLKQFLGSSTSADQQTGAGIKKIETSPANVEYYDTLNSLAGFFKVDKNGQSPMMAMMGLDICLLAGKLRINLPQICGPLSESPIMPIIAKNNTCISPAKFFLNRFGR